MRHEPVMAREVTDLLIEGSEEWVVDGTLGSGGHASHLLEAMPHAGRLIGLDQDPRALRRAGENLAGYGDRVVLVAANFRNLRQVVQGVAPGGVDAVLLDLGVSSEQIDDRGSGFSFQAEGPLSMTMDPGHHPDARELVNNLAVAELAGILRDFGDVRNARRVADQVAKARPLSTTRDLKEAARKGGAGRPEDLARVFQAIRIAVNDEMGALREALAGLPDIVKPGGRIAVISYHSGEDRTVKHFLSPPRYEKPLPWVPPEPAGTWKSLIKGALKPTAAEVARNSRSRSARLRAARKEAS